MNSEAIHQQLGKVYLDSAARDVHGHLATLAYYARGKRVVELGVYDCSTTWALLAGEPLCLHSYDIARRDEVNQVEELVQPPFFRFTEADSLLIELEEHDVLYIDTLHTREQLSQELNLHCAKVRDFILMHDTVTFGTVDQFGESPGMWLAVQEFLGSHPEWKLRDHFTHNNGLTIIERVWL